METNKIVCGDAYELIKNLPDKSVDLIITDPPYDFGAKLHGSGIMKCRTHNFDEQINDSDIATGFDLSILGEWCRVLKGINVYVWCNKNQIIPYLDYFVKGKGCNFEIIVWQKEAPTPFCGTHYLKDKEYCLYFWETGVSPHIPYERAQTVYRTAKNIEDKRKYKHPTIKPLEIIVNMVLNSSNGGGDIVLDPFAGSGTTGVACKMTGRNYLLFEKNPEWAKVAEDRLMGTTQLEKDKGFKSTSIFDFLG